MQKRTLIFTVRNSSCGKVMFSQTSVCPPGGVSAQETSPLPLQTATAVDGTHPTGMHSRCTTANGNKFEIIERWINLTYFEIPILLCLLGDNEFFADSNEYLTPHLHIVKKTQNRDNFFTISYVLSHEIWCQPRNSTSTWWGGGVLSLILGVLTFFCRKLRKNEWIINETAFQ